MVYALFVKKMVIFAAQFVKIYKPVEHTISNVIYRNKED